MKFENSRHGFEKYSNKIVHENPPREIRVVSHCKDRRMDMTKLIVAFRNSANALKKHQNSASDQGQATGMKDILEQKYISTATKLV